MTPATCALCPEDAPRPAKDVCAACERPACGAHYRVLYSLCKACATDEGLQRLREGPPKDHPRDYLGIKWVEE